MAEQGFGLEAARAMLAGTFAPWVLDLGLVVEAVGADGVVMRLPFSERLCRVGGIVCGQALMATADTCMVLVASAALGGFREMTTVGQNSSFMRAVMGRDVLARGRALRSGRTMLFGEVTMFADGDDRPVAQATSTYALLPAPPAR